MPRILVAAHANAARRGNDDSARLEIAGVQNQRLRNNLEELRGTRFPNADNPRVCLPRDDREVAKIFVECDENALLLQRLFEDLPIAWILRPLPGPDDVVALLSELSRKRIGQTTID
jgi:hypothetical protein